MSSGSIFEGHIHISLCKVYNVRVCLVVSLIINFFLFSAENLKYLKIQVVLKNVFLDGHSN